MRVKTTKALLVLGMHRSGTSALAGTLSLLGISVGAELIPACEGVNPKGFWEHAGVVDLHERLLASIGSSWNDERPLPSRWWLLPEVQLFRRELVQMLEAEFSEAAVWMIKDPRMCRLMPLWHQVLEDLECSPHVVIILRDPREVAKSLATRDGIAEERSTLLWLQHLLDSEKWTRNYPRAIITFEELLRDWQKTIEKIESTIGLQFSNYDIAVQRRVGAFLEASLRHHTAGECSAGRITTLAISAYNMCAGPGVSKGNDLSFDALGHQVSELASLIAPWSDEIQVLRKDRDFCRAELIGLDYEVVRIKNTFSWRVTAPLRVVWNYIKKWRL